MKSVGIIAIIAIICFSIIPIINANSAQTTISAYGYISYPTSLPSTPSTPSEPSEPSTPSTPSVPSTPSTPSTSTTQPVFETDFTGTTDSLSNFPFRTTINAKDGSATASIIDDSSATGNKAFKMEVYDGMPTHDRCELNMFIGDMSEITNEYYVETTIKFRSDYDLTTPHDYPTWNGWHEFVTLAKEWVPNDEYYHMPLTLGKSGDGFAMSIRLIHDRNDGSGSELLWSEKTDINLPRGEYFTIKYYVLRHPTNGAIKVWLNDSLIFDVSGVPTMLRQEFYTIAAKLYGGEIIPEKTMWVDSVKVYNQIP